MILLRPNTQTLPNPAKLMDSLRHTGYDNYNAIADIIDNSIDANAENIWIEIHTEKKDFVIKVIDDGIGMDEATLIEALKLGSEVEKNIDSDLGRFGMGLCTAGLSMSRRTTVITKQKDTDLVLGVNDLDWIIELNEFKSYIGKADGETTKLFEELTKGSSHGTAVIFSKSDKIQNTNVTIFANTLKREIGRIFRRFIEAGKKFYVNGKIVPIEDPLMLSEPATYVYSDEEYPIKVEAQNGEIADSIRVRMVLLPDFGKLGNEARGINPRNQGFYVLRNERELFAGETLEVYTRDPHYNRFRAEIYFSGTLDELMGVHFTKRSISMSQSLRDKIREITRSQITHLRAIAEEQRPKAEKEVSHEEPENLISKKSKLLIKPAPEIEKGKVKKEKPKQPVVKVSTEAEKEKSYERLRRICRFEEHHLDRIGPLFDPFMEGSKVVIRWNVDHPFYEKILVSKKEDKTFVTAIDFLIYSLASAELKSRNDENISLLENIRSDMSTNLRVLLD
ncbi:MAG: ATP-binding protein [Planctomycetota bacterium]|nr:ATP-binding protein [Planctomycetota bacterium]